jgi:hypothetical protein
MLKRSALGCAAGALVAAALAPAAGHAQAGGQAVTSTFTKEAVAVRPGGATPVAGQVAVGQRIDYVLTALAQGANGVPASGIVDVLSPNQSYVPGTLQLPPGWTANPNPPYAPNPPNRTTYTAPAGASMLSLQMPVGGNSASESPKKGGDGMLPIPGAANGNVYAVFHHADALGQIDCWSALTLVRCAGFPQPISTGNDVVTLYNFNAAVVQQRYIYYAAVQRTSSAAYAGLACWDTAVDQPCAFQRVGTSPGIVVAPSYQTASSEVAGALLVPGTSRVLIAVKNSLFCYDMSAGPGAGTFCPYWTAGGVTTAPAPHQSSSMAYFMDLELEFGPNPARAYVSVGGNADRVQCVSLGTSASNPAAICPGWSATPKDAGYSGPPHGYAQRGLDLYAIPILGVHGAICLHNIGGYLLSIPPSNTQPACWNPQGQVVNLSPFGSGTHSPAANVAFTSMVLGSAAGANRVIFARWHNSPLCLDFVGSTPSVCGGGWGSNLPQGLRDYGYAPDPLAPDRCVLALGDSGIIHRFDGKTGRAGCPVTYQTTGDPMGFFCQTKPTQLDWSQVVIRNRPAQLNAGTIVVRDGTTGAVLQTIFVTSANSYSIASIQYASHHTLTVEFTPAYSSGASVTPYFLEVQFTANQAPQICYQARVVRCGPINNTATFGPRDSVSNPPRILPSSWTKTDSVDLGRAQSGPCDPCDTASGDSLDLSIQKQALFTPWTVGSLGDFEVVVTVEQGTFNSFTAAAPTFVDNLPAGLTYNTFSGTGWSCSASGQQVSCTYNGPVVPAGQQLPPVTITVNVVGPEGTLRNCAVLGPDANLGNNRSCAEVEVGPCEVDLAIRKEALGTPWTVGGTGTFQIRVAVIRGTLIPSAAATPTFTDVLPAGVTFQSFAPQPPWSCTAVGQQVSCTYNGLPVAAPNALPPVTITVNVVGPPGGIVNCAVLAADENPANNRSCVDVSIRGDSVPADTLDLAIRKATLQAPATVGAVGAFEIRVQVLQGVFNPATAPTPTFVDVLPPGLVFQSYTPAALWNCIASGPQVACTYTGMQSIPAPNTLPLVTIVVRAVGAGPMVNCAGLGPDANLANNRSCVELTVGPGNPQKDSLDLAVRKEIRELPAMVGAVGAFTIRTQVVQGTLNPATAATPTFVDVLPPGLVFQSYAPASLWNCTVSGQQVSCTYTGPPVTAPNTLPPVTIVVRAVGAGPMVNCARLGADANLTNNRSCVELSIPGSPQPSADPGPASGPGAAW